MKRLYMPHVLKTDLELLDGTAVNLPDGWAGVMPVYETIVECRYDYPDTKITILEIETPEGGDK